MDKNLHGSRTPYGGGWTPYHAVLTSISWFISEKKKLEGRLGGGFFCVKKERKQTTNRYKRGGEKGVKKKEGRENEKEGVASKKCTKKKEGLV